MALPDDLRDELRRLAERASEAGALDDLAREAAALAHAARPAPGGEGRFPELVGRSAPMLALFETLERVARVDVPILIQGESGTGKELVARALHETSARAGKPYVSENCAAIPETLIESELFGSVKGAFTGAVADRPGLFVEADGGTLFLDEIGDMALATQRRLLRVLQDGELRPVGSNATRRVDVRLISASNRDLATLVRDGAFREDLYYRINTVTVAVPALRERGDDIPLLARHFLEIEARELGREVPELTDAALAALVAHRWPGNVRELRNEVRRCLVMVPPGEAIDARHLSPEVAAARSG